MIFKGTVWKFGDNIDTDAIIPARYLNTSDPKELAKHCMEDADPDFMKKMKAGDIILVPRSGHTEAHISVILKTPDLNYLFAGDTSYTQELMLRGKIDGVSSRAKDAYETIHNIQQFTATVPTVYMPSHDPASDKRLDNKEVVVPTALTKEEDIVKNVS